MDVIMFDKYIRNIQFQSSLVFQKYFQNTPAPVQ